MNYGWVILALFCAVYASGNQRNDMTSRKHHVNTDFKTSVNGRYFAQGHVPFLDDEQKPVYAMKRVVAWNQRSQKKAAFDDIYWKVLLQNSYDRARKVQQRTRHSQPGRPVNQRLLKTTDTALDAMINRLVGKRSLVYYLFNEFFSDSSYKTGNPLGSHFKKEQFSRSKPMEYKSRPRGEIPPSPLDSLAAGILG